MHRRPWTTSATPKLRGKETTCKGQRSLFEFRDQLSYSDREMTSYPREKSDGELPLPKTFLTKRGALMLYSAPDDTLFGKQGKHRLYSAPNDSLFGKHVKHRPYFGPDGTRFGQQGKHRLISFEAPEKIAVCLHHAG